MARSLPPNPPAYLTEIMATELYRKRQQAKENAPTTTLSLKARLDLKNRAVELKGGKCSLCGYSKCSRALEFHHNDPSQKNFTISAFIGAKFWRSGWTVSEIKSRVWQKVVKELENCTLLCANCHREVEAGVTDLKGGRNGS